MQKESKNRMITSARNKAPRDLSARDRFIIEKSKDFTPTEILTLMKREGFTPVARSRVYQILEANGVKPKA